MTRSKFGNHNSKVVASSIYGLEDFVSNLAGSVDTSELEAKTQNISSDESKTTVTGDLNVGNSSPELVLIQEDMSGDTLVGSPGLNGAAVFLPDQGKLVFGKDAFVVEDDMQGGASYTVAAGMTRSIECSTIFQINPWGASRDTFIGWRIGDLVWNTAILYQNGGSSQFDISVNSVVIKSVYYEIDPSGGQALIRWTYDPNTQRYQIFDGDTVVLDWTDPTIVADKGEGGMFDIFGGTNNEDVMVTADIFSIVLKNPESDTTTLGVAGNGVNINGLVDINQKLVSETTTSALLIDSSINNDETVLINTNRSGTVVNTMAEFKRYEVGGLVRFNSYDVNGADFGSQLVLNNDPLTKSITMGNSMLGPNAITVGGAADSLGFFGVMPVTQPNAIDENIAGVLQVLRDYGLIGDELGEPGGPDDGVGNKEIFNFTGKIESDYLSLLTGSGTGVENTLYNGEYITVKSNVAASAGRVMSFGSNNNPNEYAVEFCDGNTGEQNASSQALGILMDDVTPGNYCRVATKGICSVLVGTSTTAQRGCLITLGGSACKVGLYAHLELRMNLLSASACQTEARM